MGVWDGEDLGATKTGFQSLGLQVDLEGPCAEMGKVERETHVMGNQELWLEKVNFEIVIHSTSGEEVTAGMSAKQKSVQRCTVGNHQHEGVFTTME